MIEETNKTKKNMREGGRLGEGPPVSDDDAIADRLPSVKLYCDADPLPSPCDEVI